MTTCIPDAEEVANSMTAVDGALAPNTMAKEFLKQYGPLLTYGVYSMT